MSVRKDKIQIEVEINGEKAGKTLGEIKKDLKSLNRELQGLVPGTDAFIKKSAEINKVKSKLNAVKRATNGVAKGMNKARFATSKFGKVLGSLGIIALVARIANGFGDLISKSTELSKVQRKTDAQMQAVLASTGEIAGRSLEQLKAQASALQEVTLFGDEETQQAQSLLLTFTKIRGEVFDKSIPLIQDYATAMATASGTTVDLKGASIQVGKALNDPIKGISALSKSGVSFSEDQKKVIKTLQRTGDIAGAQAIILKELETQFGGSAQAAAKAAGTFEQTKNKFSDLLEQLGDFFVDFLDFVSPVLDVIIDYTSKWFTALAKGIKGAPILFAGLKAAVRQAMTNLSNQFNRGIIAAKIFAKELDLAISFKEATKQRLRDELNALKEEKEKYADTGRTIGQAYAEAIGIAVSEQREADAAKQAAKDAKLAAKQRENALAEAEEEKKRKAELAKAAAEEREKFFKEQQARAKYAFEKENLLAEAARIEGEDTELEYDARIEVNKIAYYKRLLGLLKAFGKEETNEFLKVKNDLAEITKREDIDTVTPLQTLDTSKEIKSGPDDSQKKIDKFEVDEIGLLQDKYAKAIIAEEEYELSMLELKEAALERRIALEEFYGRAQGEKNREFKKDLFETQVELNEKRAKLREDDLKNVERTEKAKEDLQKAGVKAFGDLLGLAVSHLKKDEQSRKKHASVIKAFETAKIGVNLISEVSNYWKHAADIPYFGTAIAAAQTIGAGARAGIAISQVNNQKFAGGGYTGSGFGMADETGFKPAGVVHEGEWVAPKWMRENAYFGPVIAALEGARVRGFATGGLATVSTQPSAGLAPVFDAPMPNGAGEMSMVANKMEKAVDRMANMVFRAEVVYEDLNNISNEAQESEINSGI